MFFSKICWMKMIHEARVPKRTLQDDILNHRFLKFDESDTLPINSIVYSSVGFSLWENHLDSIRTGWDSFLVFKATQARTKTIQYVLDSLLSQRLHLLEDWTHLQPSIRCEDMIFWRHELGPLSPWMTCASSITELLMRSSNLIPKLQRFWVLVAAWGEMK